jgi:hypothetical protein
MDVYLTCLVAMEDMRTSIKESEDGKNDHSELVSSNSSTDESSHSCWKKLTEEQIQLPVLLNLSACTLKLEMYNKTKTFCDLAIELPSGKKSVKCYFRRAKAQKFLGLYEDARRDLLHCLGLIKNETGKGEENEDSRGLPGIATIEKELNKLELLIQKAEINRQRQREAMQRVFSGKVQKKIIDDGGDTCNSTSSDLKDSLYAEDRLLNDTSIGEDDQCRQYSTLRAPWYYQVKDEKQQSQQRNQFTSSGSMFHLQYIYVMVERCLSRIFKKMKGRLHTKNN